jgi:hypothetical protein
MLVISYESKNNLKDEKSLSMLIYEVIFIPIKNSPKESIR